MKKLLLFDIDGTLVDTGGAGMSALTEATSEVFENEGPPLDLAGSTDGGIFRGLLKHFGQPFDEALEVRFYEVYLPKLERNLRDSSYGGHLLDGVTELLTDLEKEGHVLGLMTGNIARGAEMKCARHGIGEFFKFGSYGDDHWDRNKLGPIALERAVQLSGQDFAVEDILVIGDTPKDVACAHAFGAQCVAVATGAFSATQLEECGADRVLENLVGVDLLATS